MAWLLLCLLDFDSVSPTQCVMVLCVQMLAVRLLCVYDF